MLLEPFYRFLEPWGELTVLSKKKKEEKRKKATWFHVRSGESPHNSSSSSFYLSRETSHYKGEE